MKTELNLVEHKLNYEKKKYCKFALIFFVLFTISLLVTDALVDPYRVEYDELMPTDEYNYYCIISGITTVAFGVLIGLISVVIYISFWQKYLQKQKNSQAKVEQLTLPPEVKN